jgi:sterol 3beta-glucosyltransferase
MRVTLLAIGGRGDVWPYLAFGLGLQRAGHSVKVATHEDFESSVRELGLSYSRVSGNPRDLVASEAGQRWLASGRNTVKFMRRAGEATEPLTKAGAPDMLKACLSAEAIIFSPLAFSAAHFAERLGVPVLGADGVPMGRTRVRPHVLMPTARSLGGPLNLLTHFGSSYVGV